jgi:hypothetical protein
MIITKANAINSLLPNAEFVVHQNGNVDWIKTPNRQLTDAEIDAEIVRLASVYNANEYARKRAPEYPPLTDLADALYHQSKGDETKLTAYLAKCEAVKQKYPKE